MCCHLWDRYLHEIKTRGGVDGYKKSRGAIRGVLPAGLLGRRWVDQNMRPLSVNLRTG